MIVTSTTTWFNGQEGPKIFYTNCGRIQLHEFALKEQEKFLEQINNNFKNKNGQDTQGVYILLGEVEGTDNGFKQKIYVGEGNMMSRLYDHKKNENKSFVKRAILITSKDERMPFSKGELQFIEKELIRRFWQLNYDVQNKNSGQGQLIDNIERLKLLEEIETIAMGLESMGISFKDETIRIVSKSEYINKDDELEEIEIYTKVPNSDQIIKGKRNSDGTYTIYKGQTIKHKARANRWGQERIKKSLEAAKVDDRLNVEGTVDGYIIKYLQDVIYKTWSPSLYFIQGGIAAQNTWKNDKTNQSINKK